LGAEEQLLGIFPLLAATGRAQDSTRAIPEISREASPDPVEVEVWCPETISKGITSDVSGWLPVCFELSTRRSGAQTVEIEGSLWSGDEPDKTEPSFQTRRVVEVNPGASRRVWIYLHYAGASSDERYMDHHITSGRRSWPGTGPSPGRSGGSPPRSPFRCAAAVNRCRRS
jgi:hypothetical protein